MFWLRIHLGGREYLGVLDTGATICILAKNILPRRDLKNIMPTAAIRMGDGHVVHSCGDCEVDVPMGSRSIGHRFYVMDTEAFDFVLGTDFFVEQSQILSLTLQAPYVLQMDHGNGGESVPLEQFEHTSTYLRVCKKEPSTMMVTSKTEDYQLLGDVLHQGVKELGYSREDLNVELFDSGPASFDVILTQTCVPYPFRGRASFALLASANVLSHVASFFQFPARLSLEILRLVSLPFPCHAPLRSFDSTAPPPSVGPVVSHNNTAAVNEVSESSGVYQ